MNIKTVRVLRAFYFKGKPTRIGETLDLPNVFALEMIAAKKAEPADKAEAPAGSKGDDDKNDGKAGKGGKHVG